MHMDKIDNSLTHQFDAIHVYKSLESSSTAQQFEFTITKVFDSSHLVIQLVVLCIKYHQDAWTSTSSKNFAHITHTQPLPYNTYYFPYSKVKQTFVQC